MTGENHYATASRRKILEILKESKDKTVTAAQIGEQLRQMDSEVNITTIYRYLDRLEKDGTVIRYVSGKVPRLLISMWSRAKAVATICTFNV